MSEISVNAKKELYSRDFSKQERENCMIKKIKIAVTIAFVVAAMVLAKHFFNQKFDSVEAVQEYMKSFGLAAPFLLMVFQAFQVVIPVLPGYLGCAAGAVAFGSMAGFWCNYIGISLGSIMAYFLARNMGFRLCYPCFPGINMKNGAEKLRTASPLAGSCLLPRCFPCSQTICCAICRGF